LTQRGDTQPDSISALRRRLTEAEETLAAIRMGEVDAVVVEGAAGQQIYCLESPDEPFRIFVEKMQEGALTLNGDGTIVYCNRFFADLVKQPLEHVRGRPMAEFIAAGDEASFRDMLQVATAESVRGESHLQLDGGETVPVQLAFNRLPAEDVRRFGVVVTDLTERERLNQLEVQRQAAEEAKAARDHFLAMMSHELRTPLSAILGWAQVLQRREELPELVQQGLEVILRNAWAQSHLIEDLLDVSKILAGKLRLDLKPTELAAVVRAAVASARPGAAAKGITMTAALPQRPLTVRGDANRLQQVIGNLLSNAVKFSSAGDEIRIGLNERDGLAELTVADTGVGIPPAFLPRLFEMYQQIEDTETHSAGLGLGLAIVRQLTELHGGEVSAKSAGEGRGAEFTVRLPLVAAAEDEEAVATVRARLVSLTGLRLLVVEDQQDERDMLAEMLAGAGAMVLTAATAPQALGILEDEHVDLLISDISLPEVDGYELIRRVRASGRSGRDLPAVAVTAFADREVRRQALVAGYQMHIPKPLDQDELHAVVANLVGPGGGAESSNT
jgi:PAS domain S-box-containing protein